jgi:hypothetical protein
MNGVSVDMIKAIGNYFKNKSELFYIEVITVLVIIAICIGFIIPKQIHKINQFKKNTDISNATIIGSAAENIIKNNEGFMNYETEKLNINKQIDINSEMIDDKFIRALIKEIKNFNIDKLPTLKYKKNGYNHFSITIKENKVSVYANNKNVEKDLRMYPNIDKKE